MKRLLSIALLSVLLVSTSLTLAVAMSPGDFPTPGMPTPQTPPEVDVIVATVDLVPGTINLKSRGKYVHAYIELPSGYDVANIVLDSVVLADDDCPALAKGSKVGDRDNDGILDLKVKFARKSLKSAIVTGGNVELTISGSLTDDGPVFVGTDTVRVIK